MLRHPKVETFILKHKNWSQVLDLLRSTILNAGLQEEMKWGVPVYSLDKQNIVGIGAFKSYAGLWFFQGALLKDENSKLINAQEGVTKALRQWRFNTFEELVADVSLLDEYLQEAIQNCREGKTVKNQPKKLPPIPELLQNAFDKDTDLASAFLLMTDFKKREFIEFLNEARKEETRLRRLEKSIELIKEGKGLNDKYRKD